MTDAESDPGRRTIVVEVVLYVVMFVAVGALFVAYRVLREGPRVLTYDVRTPK